MHLICFVQSCLSSNWFLCFAFLPPLSIFRRVLIGCIAIAVAAFRRCIQFQSIDFTISNLCQAVHFPITHFGYKFQLNLFRHGIDSDKPSSLSMLPMRAHCLERRTKDKSAGDKREWFLVKYLFYHMDSDFMAALSWRRLRIKGRTRAFLSLIALSRMAVPLVIRGYLFN